MFLRGLFTAGEDREEGAEEGVYNGMKQVPRRIRNAHAGSRTMEFDGDKS